MPQASPRARADGRQYREFPAPLVFRAVRPQMRILQRLHHIRIATQHPGILLRIEAWRFGPRRSERIGAQNSVWHKVEFTRIGALGTAGASFSTRCRHAITMLPSARRRPEFEP